jgi:hypothetical protein
MGRVISIEDWRARHPGALDRPGRRAGAPDATAHPAGRGRAAADPVARLERALARLEPLLQEATRRGRGTKNVHIETELLAVSGAVSLELYGEAAVRVERLAGRLARMGLPERAPAD